MDRGLNLVLLEINGKDRDGTVITNAGILFKKYPNLTKVNFTCDSNHAGHIHVSFGPTRAGTYESWLISSGGDGSQTDTTSGAAPAGSADDLTELGQSFATKTGAIKNTNALYKALVNYGGYVPEAAAILMCIAERESSYSPGSFNGRVNSSNETPPGTADYSVGLWQFNFIGSPTYVDGDITVAYIQNGKVMTEKIKGYKLVDDHYIANGTKNAATAKVQMKKWFAAEPNKAMTGKVHSDPRLWNALTQIYLAKIMTTQKTDGWMFWNWGEYPKTQGKVGDPYDPNIRPPTGWLRELKFQTAVNFYVTNNPGKTREDLVKWVKKPGNMDGNARSTKEFLDRWLQGTVFNIDGTIDTAKSSSATSTTTGS